MKAVGSPPGELLLIRLAWQTVTLISRVSKGEADKNDQKSGNFLIFPFLRLHRFHPTTKDPLFRSEGVRLEHKKNFRL